MSDLQPAVGDLFEWRDPEDDEYSVPRMGIVRAIGKDGVSLRVSGVLDPCDPDSGGKGWSAWVNEPERESGPPLSFDVTLTASITLAIGDVWPDNDGPSSPVADDVKRLMESCGRKRAVLDEWCLLDDLRVSVDGVEVWA